ncbi:hypothetical protein ACCO45_010355 [Purpureocillium lilacinum]|uniref:Uncharacterized protein n=1 Tax=Purpureocillium lilacinum TaxID=33203 RepID=A0ACC4DFA0_PURLI
MGVAKPTQAWPGQLSAHGPCRILPPPRVPRCHLGTWRCRTILTPPGPTSVVAVQLRSSEQAFSLLSSALIVHVDIRTSNLDSPRRGRLLGRLWGREAGLEARMAVEAPGELSQIWRHAPTDPRGNERHAHVTGRSISHGGLGFQPERPRFGGDASRRWSGRPSLASRVVGLCIKTGRRVGASTWMSVQNPPPRAGSLVSTSAGRAGVTANPQRPWRRPVWSGVRG